MHQLSGRICRVEDPRGEVLVIAGPFVAATGALEFQVVPLYSAEHPDFMASSDDLMVELPGRSLFAALWNSRPARMADLIPSEEAISDEQLEEIREAYWQTITGQSQHDRTPKRGWFRRQRIRRFQQREAARWTNLSGGALVDNLAPATDASARSGSASLGDLSRVIACVNGIGAQWTGPSVNSLLTATNWTILDYELPVTPSEADAVRSLARVYLHCSGEADVRRRTHRTDQYEMVFTELEASPETRPEWLGHVTVLR